MTQALLRVLRSWTRLVTFLCWLERCWWCHWVVRGNRCPGPCPAGGGAWHVSSGRDQCLWLPCGDLAVALGYKLCHILLAQLGPHSAQRAPRRPPGRVFPRQPGGGGQGGGNRDAQPLLVGLLSQPALGSGLRSPHPRRPPCPRQAEIGHSICSPSPSVLRATQCGWFSTLHLVPLFWETRREKCRLENRPAPVEGFLPLQLPVGSRQAMCLCH